MRNLTNPTPALPMPSHSDRLRTQCFSVNHSLLHPEVWLMLLEWWPHWYTIRVPRGTEVSSPRVPPAAKFSLTVSPVGCDPYRQRWPSQTPSDGAAVCRPRALLHLTLLFCNCGRDHHYQALAERKELQACTNCSSFEDLTATIKNIKDQMLLPPATE